MSTTFSFESMLQLCFFKSFPFPYAAPIACHYLHHADGFECDTIDFNELHKFIETCKAEEYIPVARYIRMPHLDASAEVRNRYAVSHIVLYKHDRPLTKQEFWKYLRYNMQALQGLNGVTKDKRIIQAIEECIWSTLPPYWKAYARRFVQRFTNAWGAEAYEVYYCPDYTWKTGKNKGRTTMDVLNEAWNTKYVH